MVKTWHCSKASARRDVCIQDGRTGQCCKRKLTLRRSDFGWRNLAVVFSVMWLPLFHQSITPNIAVVFQKFPFQIAVPRPAISTAFFFVVSHSSSNQILGYYFKLSHDRFLPYPSPFHSALRSLSAGTPSYRPLRCTNTLEVCGSVPSRASCPLPEHVACSFATLSAFWRCCACLVHLT
jgi:hypothetical protein